MEVVVVGCTVDVVVGVSDEVLLEVVGCIDIVVELVVGTMEEVVVVSATTASTLQRIQYTLPWLVPFPIVAGYPLE
jgi:hypothetical protein